MFRTSRKYLESILPVKQMKNLSEVAQDELAINALALIPVMTDRDIAASALAELNRTPEKGMFWAVEAEKKMAAEVQSVTPKNGK